MKLAALAFALGIVVAAGALAQTAPAGNFDDLSARAVAARKADKIPQAIELYKKAVALRPEWQEGLWSLGLLEYEVNRYAAGSETFKRLVVVNAQAAPAWALLGLCEFETRHYGQALADMKHGVSLGAVKNAHMGEVIAYHEALALSLTGQFDEALKKFAVFAHSGPVSDSVLLAMGAAALHTPLLPKSIPEDRQALYRQAGKTASLVLARDYQQADQSFAHLLAGFPHAPHVHYFYGVYMLARNPGLAIDQFKQELRIDPKNADALSTLAFALVSRGDAQQALPYAQEASEQAPKSAMAQYVYGRALVETGACRRGIAQLLRAEPMDPSNTDIPITLAHAYSLIGRPAEARREREKSFAMTKDVVHVAHQ